MKYADRKSMIEATVFDLQGHEGFRARPYKDTVGVLTFGHGLTYLTETESRLVVRHRIIHECIPSLLRQFPKFDSLTFGRQTVLVNMMYNLGRGRFNGFVKMIKAIRASDYPLASREMLDSKWSRQVGERAESLASMMEAG